MGDYIDSTSKSLRDLAFDSEPHPIGVEPGGRKNIRTTHEDSTETEIPENIKAKATPL